MTTELEQRRNAAIAKTAELAALMLAQPTVRVPDTTAPQLPDGSTTEVFPELIQGTDEWLAQRRGMITASAIGQLLTARAMSAIEYACPDCKAEPGQPCISKVKRDGVAGAPIQKVHPDRSAVAVELRDVSPPVVEQATGDTARSLIALLAAERITGRTDPTFINDDMLRGIEDEPRAVDVYAEHFHPVRHVGFMVRSWGRNKLGYSPDGLVGKQGLIEVKSRRAKGQVLTVVSGEVPAANMAQLQAGLFVSGREWIDYLSYSGGMKFYKLRVLPDPRWFDAIAKAVEAFETAVTAMVDTYNTNTADMPMTERIETEMFV